MTGTLKKGHDFAKQGGGTHVCVASEAGSNPTNRFSTDGARRKRHGPRVHLRIRAQDQPRVEQIDSRCEETMVDQLLELGSWLRLVNWS